MNTWVLRRDFDALKQQGDEETRLMAARVATEAAYPVDSVIFASDGTFLGHRPVNEMFADLYGEYQRLLDGALEALAEHEGETSDD